MLLLFAVRSAAFLFAFLTEPAVRTCPLLLNKIWHELCFQNAIKDEDDHDSMPEFPPVRLPPHSHNSKHGMYFILEKASLVAAYVGKVSSIFFLPLMVSFSSH
ncbi:hypothetical protein Fmac_018564 [Flemingia macrophylla]|uniref:Secreted protein n=1 Tax=Flemingia macrophylla TaxID=520843 RepID=A0ABD1M5B6_9FABA